MNVSWLQAGNWERLMRRLWTGCSRASGGSCLPLAAIAWMLLYLGVRQ